MSAVENSKLAIEEHQKIHVLEKTQKSDTAEKNKVNPRKRKAAMLSSLDSLANMLIEEHASDEVAKDEQKMNKRRLGSSNGAGGAADDAKGSKKSGKSGKKGKPSAPSSKKDTPPTPTPKPPTPAPAKHESMFDQLMAHDDPLVALVMAGIEIQEKTNGMLSGLAKTGEMISKASTDAAKVGNDWMKDFYNHGTTSGAPGSTAAGKDKYIFLVINVDGSYSYYTSPTGPTGPSGSVAYSQWVEGIMDKQGKGTNDPPGGLSSDEYKILLADTVKRNYMNSGAWEGNSVTYAPVTGIPGASGAANSAEFSQLMSIWQFVQSQVSQTNNQFQTVAGLPSTMMQSLMQAISTGRGAESSTNQAIGTAASLVNGWAGV